MSINCRINKWFSILSLCFVAAGCSRALPPKRYVHYYDDLRLKGAKTIERNGYKMTIAYRPGDYYAAREMAFDSTIDRKRALERYEKSVYLIASIEPIVRKKKKNEAPASGNLLEKDEIMKRIYEKKEDAFLVRGADTIEAMDCRYERDWENATVGTYIIAFKDKKDDLKKYNLVLRNFKLELGTVILPLSGILKKRATLRG